MTNDDNNILIMLYMYTYSRSGRVHLTPSERSGTSYPPGAIGYILPPGVVGYWYGIY